jgi:hypothetical protein
MAGFASRKLRRRNGIRGRDHRPCRHGRAT